MFIVVKMSGNVYSFANTYLLLARGEHFGGVGKIQNGQGLLAATLLHFKTLEHRNLHQDQVLYTVYV
jgi:hypothetical protein